MNYEAWIGRRVQKRGRGKPFKSTFKINTVKGIVDHPYRPGRPAFLFFEDDSFVSCETCELVQDTEPVPCSHGTMMVHGQGEPNDC